MQTTQGVTAKYTELYDISTEIGENVHYKIHTPTGVSHMKKLAGFYKQFKEYKYLGASIAWVPITTLPKDLLGVGYEAGDGVDPRDLINPILHKGYKGENLVTDYLSERTLWSENEDATDAFSQGIHDSTNVAKMTESGGASYQKVIGDGVGLNPQASLRALYYTSLTDPEWGKAHPREGFYRELFPVVRTLATNRQISGNAVPQTANKEEPSGTGNTTNELITDRDITSQKTMRVDATTNVGAINQGQTPIVNTGITTKPDGKYDYSYGYLPVNQGEIFSHEFERLGWMETSGSGGQSIYGQVSTIGGEATHSLTDLDINRMPKVYMYLVQTPPAYKNKQYYRMSITHNFAFRKFRQVYGIDMANMWSDQKLPDNLVSSSQMDRMHHTKRTIAGMKMYDETGTLHDDDFIIPEYEPALENSIEADGEGTTIEKISDGVA